MKINTEVIKLVNISKKYSLHHEKPTLVENILNHGHYQTFWALKDINFSVKRNERVGIVGPNGSGKTTLLKLISGIATPDNGRIDVKGKVVSLIELEAGFHPELTGEENIFLNSLLLGMTKEEIRTRYQQIVEFSGITKFIDSPLYSYSDGMKLRLGFSILVNSDMDILVLDENISVGDQDFHKKAHHKIKDLISSGVTLMVATHDMTFIRRYCHRVVWLDQGRIRMFDKTNHVLKNFLT